jgi:deoxyribonuclease-4
MNDYGSIMSVHSSGRTETIRVKEPGVAKRELLLGAHVSIAGGIEKALLRGEQLGCRTIQIFTKNANRWQERSFRQAEIDLYRDIKNRTGIEPIIAHNSYLTNLATIGAELYKKSIYAMVQELERCETLGVRYLVVHPGSHQGSGEERGITKIVHALNEIHETTKGFAVAIALEMTAGQGTSLGYRLEQIAQIMNRVEEGSRLAFCLDTCHSFAAGYELRSKADYDRFFRDIDGTIGLEKLKVIHLNDSKGDCGSRVDRHEDIGKGMIGEEPFRWIMNDERLEDVPKIIETPGLGKIKDYRKDEQNLNLLRNMVED